MDTRHTERGDVRHDAFLLNDRLVDRHVMSLLTRLVEPFADLVRWGEPWDVEDDDPLLDAPAGVFEEPANLWA